jgi:hypothetical protein
LPIAVRGVTESLIGTPRMGDQVNVNYIK